MSTTGLNRTSAVRSATVAALLMAFAVGVGAWSPRAVMGQTGSLSEVKAMIKAELPPDALEITDAMKSAKVGQTITVRGNVAMSKDAFVENRAIFTLVDESTRKGCCPPSDRLPDTACDIPAEGRATVQIVGTNGKPLRAGLSGAYGLKPGAEVFVTGKVDTANGTDALVLTALSLHVPRTPLPTGFFVDTPPENVADVSEARKAGVLRAGDTVALRGRIGGSKEPFVAGRAVFTLMGRGLKACSENPDDLCPTPWDYCCETKEEILSNSVTVRVVDSKGQVLRTDMKGRRGLRELSEIVVVGKVTSADAKAAVIDAAAIHVPR